MFRKTSAIVSILREYLTARYSNTIMAGWQSNQVLLIENKTHAFVTPSQIDSLERKYLPISHQLKDFFSLCRNPNNVRSNYIILVISGKSFKAHIISRKWESWTQQS